MMSIIWSILQASRPCLGGPNGTSYLVDVREHHEVILHQTLTRLQSECDNAKGEAIACNLSRVTISYQSELPIVIAYMRRRPSIFSGPKSVQAKQVLCQKCYRSQQRIE